jgi:hypothetical protein
MSCIQDPCAPLVVVLANGKGDPAVDWTATNADEYRKYIEKDAALERRFQKILVGEPTVEATIAILRGLQEKYEVHHGVEITDPAIVAAAVVCGSGKDPADANEWPIVGYCCMPSGYTIMVDEVRAMNSAMSPALVGTYMLLESILSGGRVKLRSCSVEPDGRVTVRKGERAYIYDVREVAMSPMVKAAEDRPLPKVHADADIYVGAPPLTADTFERAWCDMAQHRHPYAQHAVPIRGEYKEPSYWTPEHRVANAGTYSNLFTGQPLTIESFERVRRDMIGHEVKLPRYRWPGYDDCPKPSPSSIFGEVFHVATAEGVEPYRCISVMGETRDFRLGAVLRNDATGDVFTVACDDIERGTSVPWEQVRAAGRAALRSLSDAKETHAILAGEAEATQSPRRHRETPEYRRAIEREIVSYTGAHRVAFVRAMTSLCEGAEPHTSDARLAAAAIAKAQARLDHGYPAKRVYEDAAKEWNAASVVRTYLRALGHDVA